MQLSDLLPKAQRIRFISTGTGTSAANPDEWIAERSESDKMRKAQASITYALIAINKMYLFNHWSHCSSVAPPGFFDTSGLLC